uniref:Global nitrogen transcriptional regulator n=1 Tax=Polysiphonia scopulorum TaxID=257860 RepID=A0A1Z1MHX2_9FLOR|nr:global nitrogen transcriptional regulator [Polysiphonia scopulorum]ARW65680.1 global nitrogen transcriptional regulator [Polysiphonia scopulorum]
MQWMKFLSINKSKYYIYKLNKLDHLVVTNNNHDQNKIIIILYGITSIVKTFSNKETIPIAILSKNNIFISKTKDNSTYYKLIALDLTYIITFNSNIDNKNFKIQKLNTIEYYINTLEKYENMNQIIVERQSKTRIFQLIILICLQFGTIKKNMITIPFKLSQEYIAIMTGLSRNTVNKVVSILYKKGIIGTDKKTFNIINIINTNLK